MSPASEDSPPTPTPVPALDESDPWRPFVAFLSPVMNGLECGLAIINAEHRIVFVNDAMGAIFRLKPSRLLAMSPSELIEHTLSVVEEPPPLLRERRMLPVDTPVLCEEFEIKRPSRSVVRWVARRVTAPAPAVVVVCEDITAAVDLGRVFEHLAVTDRLTGLQNRRGIEETLRREIARALRYGTLLSVSIVDVDHFKDVNDVHGHAAGDRVLARVAEGIRRTLRTSDEAGRWGGEEFLVMMPSTRLEDGRRAMERIRGTLEATSFGLGRPVTISAGVAELAAGDDDVTLVARADEALYAAKRTGRNRVV